MKVVKHWKLIILKFVGDKLKVSEEKFMDFVQFHKRFLVRMSSCFSNCNHNFFKNNKNSLSFSYGASYDEVNLKASD